MSFYNNFAKARIVWLVSITLFLCGCSSLPDQEGDHAARYGRQITLKSVGVTFDIPGDWLEWYQKYHNNLHLTVEELQTVKSGTGEWDTEFSAVVNRVLPFDRCAVHVGGEGWGQESGSFGDLQVRVYNFGEITQEKIEELIEQEGVAEVKEITGAPNITIQKSTEGSWRRNVLKFGRFYDDYGATAYVDFRIRQFKNDTIVVVFMYTDYPYLEEQIMSILNSFQEK